MNTIDIPEQIPVFPLTGAILLPRGHLPLNIFEPRYREMVEFAADTHGIIGMIQPVGSNISAPVDNNDQFGTAKRGRELYSVGCAGIISEIKQTAPGQYFILLTGKRRFEIKSELPLDNSFREVIANYDPFKNDGDDFLSDPDPMKDKLFSVLHSYLAYMDLKIDLESFADIDDEELINSISMILPFEASEKQLILESKTLDTRAALVMQIMDFKIRESNSSAQPNLH